MFAWTGFCIATVFLMTLTSFWKSPMLIPPSLILVIAGGARFTQRPCNNVQVKSISNKFRLLLRKGNPRVNNTALLINAYFSRMDPHIIRPQNMQNLAHVSGRGQLKVPFNIGLTSFSLKKYLKELGPINQDTHYIGAQLNGTHCTLNYSIITVHIQKSHT